MDCLFITLESPAFMHGEYQYEAIVDNEEKDLIAPEEMKTNVGYLFDCAEKLGYIDIVYRRSPSHQKLEESEYLPLLRMDRPAEK